MPQFPLNDDHEPIQTVQWGQGLSSHVQLLMKWLTTVWANCSPGTTKFKNIPELFCSFDIQWGFVSLYCNFYTHSSLLCKCISTMSSHSGKPLTHNCAFIPELAWYIFINKAIIRKKSVTSLQPYLRIYLAIIMSDRKT